MNSKIKNVLKVYFEHVKVDLMIALSVTLISTLVVYSSIFNSLIKIFVLVSSIVILFRYTKLLSIISTNNNIENFNWKYIFNLPLSYKDKVILVICLNLLSGFPLLFFAWTHATYISELFDSEYLITHWLLFFNLIALMVVLSLGEMRNALVLPRQSMQKFKKEERVLENVVSTFFVVDAFIILFLALYFSYEYKILISKIADFIAWSLTSKFNLIYFILLIYVLYKDLLNVLKNEKHGYKNPKNVSVKSNTVIIFSHLIIYVVGYLFVSYQTNILVNLEDVRTPEDINKFISKHKKQLNEYRSDKRTLRENIIRSGNYPLFIEAEKTIKKPTNTQKTYLGYNEYYYAIMSGNPQMIAHFETLGFDLNTKSSTAEVYPIHIALEKCNVEIVKSLLTKKVDLSILTKEGESLLHYAIKHNCTLGALVLNKLGIDKSKLTNKNEDWKTYLKKYKTNKTNTAIIELNLLQ